MSSPPAPVRDNPDHSRFEMDTPGGLAFARYRRDSGTLMILHTEVPQALEGRGLGSQLVQGMLDLMQIPYTHSGLETSVIAIDKELTKMVLESGLLVENAGRYRLDNPLPPLSDDVFSATNNGIDAWAAGVGLVTLGFVLFAINMIVTLRANRAPGMVWRRVPLFSVDALPSAPAGTSKAAMFRLFQ